jgi:hypothetical protein
MIRIRPILVSVVTVVALAGTLATIAYAQSSAQLNGVTAKAWVQSFPDNSVLIHVDFQNNNDDTMVVSSTTKVQCGQEPPSNQTIVGAYVPAHQTANLNVEGCANGPAQVLGEYLTSVQKQ